MDGGAAAGYRGGVYIDAATGELNVKLAYVGPWKAGKATCLRHIHERTRPEARGPLEVRASEVEERVAFDFQPLSLSPLGGRPLRFHLHAESAADGRPGAWQAALQGADGVLFVADSCDARREANVACLAELVSQLAALGVDPRAVPRVYAYNKRDRPDALPIAALQAALNPEGLPSFATVATLGTNVFDALKALARQVLATRPELGLAAAI